MEKGFKIGENQLTAMLINAITVKMIFTFPRLMIINSGNAGWIECIYVSIIACATVFLTLNLYKRAGARGIIEMSEQVGGKVLKIIVGLIITAFLLIKLAISVRILPESIKAALLPITPMKIVLFVLLGAVLAGAYAGIFSIARIHALFMPVSAGFFLMFMLFLIPHAEAVNLFPMFGKGTVKIFKEGIYSISIFSDILILYLIAPLCKDSEAVIKSGKKAVVISSAVSVIIVFLYNLVYSYPASEEFIFPVYQMTRLIKVGDFFQRLEALFEFIWSISMLLYTSLYLILLAWVWSEMFDTKYQKPLIFPFAVITAGLSLLPSSLSEVINANKLALYFLIPSGFLLPPLISALALKKKGLEEEKK